MLRCALLQIRCRANGGRRWVADWKLLKKKPHKIKIKIIQKMERKNENARRLVCVPTEHREHHRQRLWWRGRWRWRRCKKNLVNNIRWTTAIAKDKHQAASIQHHALAGCHYKYKYKQIKLWLKASVALLQNYYKWWNDSGGIELKCTYTHTHTWCVSILFPFCNSCLLKSAENLN